MKIGRLALFSWGLIVGPLPMVGADQRADELLQRSAKQTESVSALTADVEIQRSLGGKVTVSRGTVRLLKPNYYRLVLEGEEGRFLASDGVDEWYKAADSVSQRTPAKPQGTEGKAILPIDYLFMPVIPYVGAIGKTTTLYHGTLTRGKVTYQQVEVQRGKPGPSYAFQLLIGPDNLIHQARYRYTTGGGRPAYVETRLTNIRLNPDLHPADFAFTPQELQRLKEAQTIAHPAERPPLLPVGDVAPEFEAPQLNGPPLTLKDILRESKLVLLNFWFYH